MRELRGKKISDEIKERCLDYVQAHNGAMPALAILRVGDNPDDLAYQKSAVKKLTDFGLEVKCYEFPADIAQAEFDSAFDFINQDEEIDGILVLRPLPPQLSEQRLMARIDPAKDVDGISPVNVAALVQGQADAFAPCTAEAVIALLKGYELPLEGRHVTVIGRSLTVGKPLVQLLLRENASVTICHSRTVDLKARCASADIVVSAIGRAGFVDADFLKQDAVLVDVGINMDESGKLCGDAVWESITARCSDASPVPGGVGAVTTAILAEHLLRAAQKRAQ